MRDGFPLTRYFGYTQISKHYEDRGDKRALSIGDSTILAKLLGFKNIIANEYPLQYDIRFLKFDNDSFDALVSDQVLEHIEGNPFEAIEESFRVVKPGGLILHTTTFFNEIHDDKDFWRFSPEGLRIAVEEYGEIIECGGWGNLIAYFLIRLGLNKIIIPESKLNPLNWVATWNSERTPIFTWMLAKKWD